MSRPAEYLILALLACRMPALASELLGADPQSAIGVLTLQEAVRMALSRAPEVSLAAAQTARAGEALRETRAANRPQVLTGTGLAYNNGFPLSIEGSAPSAVQIGMSQSIFSRRNRNLILEAEEGIKASQVGSESVRNDLVARVAMVYYELHQARKLEGLWSARSESAAAEQRVIESLLEAGKARPLDVTLAKIATAHAQQQTLIAREQVHLAETELRELTAQPEGNAIRTAEPPMENPVFSLPGRTLYQKALEVHPEIRQAEANLKAREYHVEAEKGGKYPRLELVTQYALFTRFNNYQDFFNRFTRNNFLVGMSIQLPLFDGFQASARVAQSRQEVTEARLRLERQRSDLKMSIERGVSALRIARGAAELARREQEAAQESLRINQVLLEGGRIGSREMVSSQNQLREKEIAVVEANKALFHRQVELLRITGTVATVF